MKKKITRVFSLLLAVAMVFSLAACGGNTTTGGTNNNEGGAGVTAADAFDTDAFIASMPSELKGTTIKFLNWYDPDDREHEKKVIEAFEAATGINVEVIVTEYGSDYNDKLSGLVATGDAPDVIRMSEAQSVWMKSLQPIVNTGYDFSDKAWNADVKDHYSVNGIQYAANLSYSPFVLFATIVYHKDTMEEFGFDDPWELYKNGEWTWTKLEEMCAEWVKQGSDYYGVAFGNYTLYPDTAGLDFVTYDGSKWNMNLYDSTLLDNWKKNIENRENRIFVQGGNTTFDVTKHKALFSYTDSTGLEKSSVFNTKTKKSGQFAAAPVPKHEDSDYYVPVTELVGFGVPKGAKNAAAVPYFISWYGNLAKYDLDSMYFDEQSREVYEALVQEPNRFMSMSASIFTFDANPFIWHLFNNCASSQITTFIQQEEYKCQDKLDQINDVLARMDTEITK